ncbi:gamma-glutamylcyclotransferase [Bacillus sp. FJAT-49732]|uniref:Gamma-glutamylcyclotransferase family protein n=1 Tax=Lederbergia citrisecunda TaxID=2833583 RepID=A0A942TUV5_9BACI|nr:gamma-glutamylcyclotransferase family protein [Lederbergia citrisecunda]MBS4202154.1 gamma-glutamylcyclotransferase [Lederbergia citrisecunda]
MRNLVFVYGTLRRSERNHHLLYGATRIAEQAWTNGALFNTESGYPILKNTADRDVVYGELYEVSESQLARLDELEGYYGEGKNNFYDRVVNTIFTDKEIYHAFVYVMTEQQTDLLHGKVENEDWKVQHFIKQNHFLYFAYGSCMDHERFKIAGADHYFQKLVGRGVLAGYTLGFTVQLPDGGRADIIEMGGVVEGKAYEIIPDAIPYLFQREGVGGRLYRPAIIEIKINGALKEALTFIVVKKEEELAPPDHYSEEILRGGEGTLSPEYLKKIKEKIEILKGKETIV